MNSQNRNDDYDEAKALKLFKQGNREGFKMIYDQYARGIYAAGLKLLQSRELAQDLVQDVHRYNQETGKRRERERRGGYGDGVVMVWCAVMV